MKRGRIDGRTGLRTVKYRTHDNTDKIDLLPEVQKVRDFWSVRIIGPRRL